MWQGLYEDVRSYLKEAKEREVVALKRIAAVEAAATHNWTRHQQQVERLVSLLATAREQGYEPGHVSLFEENESYSIADYEYEEAMRRQSDVSPAVTEILERIRAGLTEEQEPPEEAQAPEEYPEP